MPGKPPSVIKFLKEQEIKQEQLRQQLANQEARRRQEEIEQEPRRRQEEIEKREAKEIADYLFSEYDEARARSHPPPPAPIMPTEAQLAYINLVRTPALDRAVAAHALGGAEAAQAMVAYKAVLAEYDSLEDSRRAAEEYAAAVAAYEVAKEDKNEQEIRDKAKEIGDRLFKKYGNNFRMERLFKNEVANRPYLQNAIKQGYLERLGEIRKDQKEKSRKGVQEAYEYISRRSAFNITPTERKILHRLKKAINGGSGFESDISKKIFIEYLKATNHSGGRRKTRSGRKHRHRLTYKKHLIIQ